MERNRRRNSEVRFNERNSNRRRGNRVEQLREIQELDFALQDTTLFLDLNPNDEKAREYYRCTKRKLTMATQRFEREHGLLTNRSMFSDDYGSYVASPWPWEKQGEEC